MEMNEILKGKIINEGLQIARDRIGELCKKSDKEDLSLSEYKESIKLHLITQLLQINDAIMDLDMALEHEGNVILESTLDIDDIHEVTQEAELYTAINDELGDILGMVLKNLIGDREWRQIVSKHLMED